MVDNKKNNIKIMNAEIAFRNLSGNPGQYNQRGERYCCVFLDDEVAETLKRDGWNVKTLMPKDEYETPRHYMQIYARFDHMPPNIFLVTSKGKTKLEESNVGLIDWAEIENVDLIIRPYDWTLKQSGKSGRKAMIKTMYVTIIEDELDTKYSNVPDSAQNTMGYHQDDEDNFD